MNKGILITSFGTTHIDTREKSIEVIENLVKEKYGVENVERAFTSDVVRRRILKNENMKVNSHKEGIEVLKNKGYSDIITMSLHILAGSEYKTKISHDEGVVTEALLYNDEDYDKIVNDNEINNMKGNDAIIFMGHGSSDVADITYTKLQERYKEKGIDNIFIATVEGSIVIEDVINKIKDRDYKKILLKPFMIVAGDHAKNDMGSDEEDSWKTALENEGYEIEVELVGLGEYELVQRMFLEKLEKVI